MKRKNFKNNLVICLYLVLMAFISVGCTQGTIGGSSYNKATQYNSGQYKNFGVMLTKCDGVTIVVAVGYNEGNSENARQHLITVIDINGDAFTYSGGQLDLQRGDTVKWVGSCLHN